MSNLSSALPEGGEASVFAGEKEVTLGDRTYLLRKKKGRKHTRKIRQLLGPIIKDLKGLGPLAEKVLSDKTEELSGGDFEAIASLAQRFSGEDFDILLDIVYDWSPEISADREFLEGEIDDEGIPIPDDEQGESGAEDIEFIRALIVILGFIYGPFVNFLNLTKKKEQEEQE